MNKTDKHAFVNQLTIYTLVMICFSGSIGLGTVWLRQQIAGTADSVRRLQVRTVELERHLSEMTTLIAAEQSPDVLEQRNIDWNLGLVRPNEPQVVRVNEHAEERLAAKRNSELFKVEPGITPVRFVLGGAR